MKKATIIVMVLIMLISISGCSSTTPAETTTAQTTTQTTTEATTTTTTTVTQTTETTPDTTVVEEEIHEVEAIDLETEKGAIKYVGYEFANSNLVWGAEENTKAIVVKFEFENYASKPTKCNETFKIQYFQNGTELRIASGIKAEAGDQYEYCHKFTSDVMKGISNEGGWPVLLEDYSPVTIMVEDIDNDEVYQIMTVDISGESKDAASGSESIVSNIWYFDYYLDDFNQVIENEWYVANNTLFTGKFSNSATTDSLLTSNILVDFEKHISIFLYEYGNLTVKNSSESYVDKYNITMRLADGTDKKVTGTMHCGNDRIFIDAKHYDTVLDALMGQGDVMFYIEDAERTVNNYLITVPTSNFSTMFSIVSNAKSTTVSE